MSYNFLKLAEEILNNTKIPMSINEMWNYAEKNNMTEELNSSGKTPWKTLGARVYVDIKNNKKTKIKQISKRPAKFGLKEFEYHLENYENEIEIKYPKNITATKEITINATITPCFPSSLSNPKLDPKAAASL